MTHLLSFTQHRAGVIAIALAFLMVLAPLWGCLGEVYTVPKDELVRIGELPAEQKGKQVRVVQQYMTSSNPPASKSVPSFTTVGPNILVVPHPRVHHFGVPHHHTGTMRIKPGVDPVPVNQGPIPIKDGSSTSDTSSGTFSGDGDLGIAIIVLIVVLSVSAAVVLTLTEGLRYDGWVQVAPEHPLHLFGEGGEHFWIPISELDIQLADWAAEAEITEYEGPMTRLKRAPLNRKGFVYGLEFGVNGLHSTRGNASTAFGTKIQLGGFFIHELGLMAVMCIGAGEVYRGNNAVNWRFGLEMQGFPIHFGRLNLGAYLTGGYSFMEQALSEDSSEKWKGLTWGGGGLLQIALTTRLSLTLRVGVIGAPSPEEMRLEHLITTGIAVY